MATFTNGRATTPAAATDLAQALIALRSALVEISLSLPVAAAAEATTSRAHAVAQLDDYVLPRLARLDAPVLAVFGGSTGAGKSTLVNALVQESVSRPGVLRPTTRSPVLVHHPDDAAWFEAPDNVLPDLPRATGGEGDDSRCLRLVRSAGLPPGLGLLDAPDVDSVVDANRELADRLLSAADMWVFVTSAARYADAVPWSYLRQAASRSAAIAVVLDRVTADAVAEVRVDLARMMVAEKLGSAPLFTIAEQQLGADRILPANVADQLRVWLIALASDAHARARVIRQTLTGAVSVLLADADRIATAALGQASAVDTLRADADAAYEGAAVAVHESTGQATLLRGEVLARWQEFVGTEEPLRNLESGVGRLRDRVVASATGKPRDSERVTEAVESSLATLMLAEAEKAAETVRRAWRAQPAGRAVLASQATSLVVRQDGLSAGHDLTEPTRQAIREWQRGVLELIESEGSDRRTKARLLSFGVNGIGAALMIVVFAQTAGLTGATTLVAQRLLEAVFSDQSVRTLTARARDDLDSRVDALFGAELARFHVALDGLGVSKAAATELSRLTAAARSVARKQGERTAVAPGRAAVGSARGEHTDARPRQRRSNRPGQGADPMTSRSGGPTLTAPAGSIKKLLGKPQSKNPAGGSRLADDLVALREVVQAGEGRLDPEALERAAAVLGRADRRSELSGDHAVVAFAGATGAGKSSLFNRITGFDLAEVGARRPTTSTTMASVWGADGAGDLLNWLGIDRRHRIEHGSALSGARERELTGLVLLDLPDHDSRSTSHRAEVDRIVELADLFIWIVDPQKYADLALHQRYLRPLRSHRDVMFVVLNQTDLLTEEEQKACRDDLVRILDEEGLGGVPVLTTSARTGSGVEDLRTAMRDRLARKRLAADRLDADVLTAADALGDCAVGECTPEIGRAQTDELSVALYRAAGAPTVVEAVDRSFRDASIRATGWPVTRWIRRRRPDPLTQLHLPAIGSAPDPGGAPAGSLAAPIPVRGARSERAVRALSAAAAAELPARWQHAIANAALDRVGELPDALDRAVTGTDLSTSGAPGWWRGCGAAAWVFLAAAVAGGAWLLLLGVGAALGSPDVPTMLLVGGLVGSLLVAAAGRAGAAVGGRRRAAVARRHITALIADVAEELVLAPVRSELDRHERVRRALAVLAR